MVGYQVPGYQTEPADIKTFIDNAPWAIRSTYHTVLKASPGAAIFGRNMLFDIPFGNKFLI